jgi:hypothetical protein
LHPKDAPIPSVATDEVEQSRIHLNQASLASC